MDRKNRKYISEAKHVINTTNEVIENNVLSNLTYFNNSTKEFVNNYSVESQLNIEVVKEENKQKDDYKKRLSQWLSVNNISRQASNDLLSEKITGLPKTIATEDFHAVLPRTKYNSTQRLSCIVSPTTNNNSSQVAEILNLLHKLEGHISVLNSKVDRLTVEVISIRSGGSTVKTKVYGDVCCNEYVVPPRPFDSIHQYNEFTNKIETEDTFKQFVKELPYSSEKSFDKFIRRCWKKMLADSLAEQFSWRGTSTKQCIRGCRVTLAIRHAFKNKFAIEDEDFDKITQKHFLYAHDRLTKFSKYASKKKTKRDNEQQPP